jgi:hypothetical protein
VPVQRMHDGRDLVLPCTVPRWDRVVFSQPCSSAVSWEAEESAGLDIPVIYGHSRGWRRARSSELQESMIRQLSSIPHRPHPSSVRLSHTTSVLNTPTMWSERRMQAFSHTSHGTATTRPPSQVRCNANSGFRSSSHVLVGLYPVPSPIAHTRTYHWLRAAVVYAINSLVCNLQF